MLNFSKLNQKSTNAVNDLMNLGYDFTGFGKVMVPANFGGCGGVGTCICTEGGFGAVGRITTIAFFEGA
jgi:hypothetical protein